MFVKKQIETYVSEEAEFDGATLLSYREVSLLLTERERMYKDDWWLHTPGYNSSLACNVDYLSGVHRDGDYVYFSYYSIRPALKFKNIGNLKVGDIFKIGDYDFKVISPELAWLYHQDIGIDIFDRKTNIYENSHIKKVIDEWYETEILGYAEKDLED